MSLNCTLLNGQWLTLCYGNFTSIFENENQVYDKKNTAGLPRPSYFPSLCVYDTLGPIMLPRIRS